MRFAVVQSGVGNQNISRRGADGWIVTQSERIELYSAGPKGSFFRPYPSRA